MRLGSAVACASVAVAVRGVAPAAEQGRRGFWFGIGGGYGSATATCDSLCEGNEREGGRATSRN